MDLRTLAPEEKTVNITVALKNSQSHTFSQAKADADAALRDAFTGSLLGKGVTLAGLGNLLYSLDSVENYRFSEPAADIEASPTVLPRLSTLTITEWGS